jgi:hypothetical protein
VEVENFMDTKLSGSSDEPQKAWDEGESLNSLEPQRRSVKIEVFAEG